MFEDLVNKVVVVTGASQGIGKAIAETFLDYGSIVIFVSRSEDRYGQSILNHPNSHIVRADVTCTSGRDQIVKCLEELQRDLDVLVCNVGSGSSVPPGTEERTDWDKSFEINFFSTVSTISCLRPYFSSNNGCILCISSICGEAVIKGAPLTYSVAKAALNAYIKGASVPLAEEGIRINGITPGNILHENSVWRHKLQENDDSVRNYLNSNVVLRRLGKPEEVAKLTLMLASDNMSFATGTIYRLDGGQVL